MTRSRGAMLPAVLLSLVLLTGCAASGSSGPLDGTAWVLVSLDERAPLPGRPITLAFEAGVIRGSSGCNTYSGSYDVHGASLTISDLMWTEMACLEAGWMDQESDYLARLAASDGFSLSAGGLELLGGGDRLLVFQPEV